MPLTVRYSWLGRVPYAQAEVLQRQLVEEVVDSAGSTGFILALEHPHVVTLGRSSSLSNLLLPPETLRERGVEVIECRRGGDVTWHGPGQLVVYPILPLQTLKPDVHWYLRMLEEAGIRTLEHFGVSAGRKPGLTGVWVKDEKAMAIGVAVRRWVTFHGAALNIASDLPGFDWIIPCGIPDKGVTSLERLSGRTHPLPDVAAVFVRGLADAMRFVTVERKGEELWPVTSPRG